MTAETKPMRLSCAAVIGIAIWLAVIVFLFSEFAGLAKAPDAPAPSFYQPLNNHENTPQVIKWLPGYEDKPLTCGQKQNDDGTGFRLIAMNEHEVVLQGSDMNGNNMRVLLHKEDFDRMFGGIWITPLAPQQQGGKQ